MPEFTSCPDPECGALGEIVDRWVAESTDGPIEHMTVHCVAGHHYMHIG